MRFPRRREPTATARASRPGDDSARWLVARQVGQFTLVGVVGLLLVGFGTAIASRRVGEREAIVDARTTALAKAQGVVEPVVTNGLLTGQPAAVRPVADVVARDVLDRNLVRVKIWTSAGTIVYSDEPRLAGARYPLANDELAAIANGTIQADVSDLQKPENRFERHWNKLLEVYLPLRTPSGRRLLFEAYFRYDAVQSAGSRIWRSFAPISLGALVALEIVQIPLAWSLARRLRQRQREREHLLRQAIEASDVERRRIASDLHDGVVQDLAGVAYSLAGAARSEDAIDDPSPVFDESARTVRASISSLRSLLVEIYPPNLSEEGLASAVGDLLARASARDVDVSIDASELHEPLPTAVTALLYRVAQEALRNVFAHSGAETIRVRMSDDGHRATLEVDDDGCGFDPATAAAAPARGHFGLKGIEGLVTDAGGELSVVSAPGEGTRVRAEVPLR